MKREDFQMKKLKDLSKMLKDIKMLMRREKNKLKLKTHLNNCAIKSKPASVMKN